MPVFQIFYSFYLVFIQTANSFSEKISKRLQQPVIHSPLLHLNLLTVVHLLKFCKHLCHWTQLFWTIGHAPGFTCRFSWWSDFPKTFKDLKNFVRLEPSEVKKNMRKNCWIHFLIFVSRIFVILFFLISHGMINSTDLLSVLQIVFAGTRCRHRRNSLHSFLSAV